MPEGSWQDNYECAEFVSRSLAAGGYIPNLGPTDAQVSQLLWNTTIKQLISYYAFFSELVRIW